LFWAIEKPVLLECNVRKVLNNPRNRVFATLASAQEIAMKIAAGKWPEAKALLLGFERLVADAGFGLLTPVAADYLNMTRLPDVPGHRDPLDKLIIAMALARDLVLISSDSIATNYPVTILLAGRARPPSTSRTRERIIPVEPLVAIEMALGFDAPSGV
jgi:PIN domain nuclease of toxin-antitoxin system